MIFPLVSFGLGIFFRRKEIGSLLLKINFFLLLPVLIFKIFSQIEIKSSDLILPFIASFIIIITYFLGNIIIKTKRIEDKAVLLIGPMIMNLSVVYPLIILDFSEKFLKNVAIFDIANGILTLTFTYSIAIKFGSGKGKVYLKKIFSPPLIALLLGLLVNYFKLTNYFNFINPVYNLVKYVIVFTIYFSLGCFFTFKKEYFKDVLISNGLRFGIGFIVGLTVLFFWNVDINSKKILMLCCMAPCGFNTLTFSVLENLNIHLAANLISISLIVYFFIAFGIIMF